MKASTGDDWSLPNANDTHESSNEVAAFADASFGFLAKSARSYRPSAEARFPSATRDVHCPVRSTWHELAPAGHTTSA